MIELIALQRFSGAAEGSVTPRQRFWSTPARARELISIGVARPVAGQGADLEAKPVPFAFETKPAPSPSSRPGPVSLQTSAAARPTATPASPSTMLSESPQPQTPSTPAISSGGKSTTKPRASTARLDTPAAKLPPADTAFAMFPASADPESEPMAASASTTTQAPRP